MTTVNDPIDTNELGNISIEIADLSSYELRRSVVTSSLHTFGTGVVVLLVPTLLSSGEKEVTGIQVS